MLQRGKSEGDTFHNIRALPGHYMIKLDCIIELHFRVRQILKDIEFGEELKER